MNNILTNVELLRCWLIKDNQSVCVLNTIEEYFEALRSSERFDFVVLNQILQPSYKDYKDLEASAILYNAKELLKANGRLVILASNLLGIQYLAGKKNNISKDYFDGYSYFLGGQEKSMFTRSQLTRLVHNLDSAKSKFFYPYPNLEYTKEIFSDGTFEKYQYGKSSYNLDNDRLYLYDETALNKLMIQEGVGEEFANAFLVVVSFGDLDDVDKIDYLKFNWDRAKQFQIVTIVNSDSTVKKTAIDQDAIGHIEKLYKNQSVKFADDIYPLEGEYSDGAITYPFLRLRNLDQVLEELFEQNDLKGFKSEFAKFYNRLLADSVSTAQYATEEFCEVFGSEFLDKKYSCINPGNIDLICDNVFVDGDNYKIIDCEWVFLFYVPVVFIIWRAINELYSKHVGLELFFSRADFLKLYNIEEEDETIFQKWGQYFAYEYAKSDSIREIAADKIFVNIQDVCNNYLSARSVSNKLFLDTENGFEDNCFVNANVEGDIGAFCLTFDIKDKFVDSVCRWIPFPNGGFEVVIERMEGISVVGTNAFVKNENTFDFCLDGGFFYLKIEAEHVVMEGRAKELGPSDKQLVLSEERESHKNNNAISLSQLDDLQNKYDALREEKERIENDLMSISNSTIWRKTEFIRNLKDGKVKQNIEENGNAATTENVPKTVRERLYYFIDGAEVTNDIFYIDGWILCEDCEILEPRVVLEDEFGIRHTFDMTLKTRPDVAVSTGLNFIGKCGVHVGGYYTSFSKQKIIFSVRVEGEIYEIDTGTYLEASQGSLPGDFCVEVLLEKEQYLYYDDFCAQNLCEETIDVSGWKVDLIVPVYNGLQYLPTLFRTIEQTDVAYRLILVNDCSPDPEVLPYLEEYVNGKDYAILLNNEKNMGFVKSVNRALKLAENHVVLVNTDVELPANWLERLMKPIFEDENIASTTPFTNSGTIFSFPNFCKDNSLFLGLSVDEIDSVFRRIKPKNVEIPTGMGFCMGMNYTAIRKVGLLDDVTFELGYGEENDWCQRAIEAGFTNVYVENIFAHHNHGGSFPSETKKRLLQQNAERLSQKHPNYDSDVAKLVFADPNKDVREFVKFELLFQHDVPFVLAFNHALGGGADSYLKQKRMELLPDSILFGEVKYNAIEKEYLLSLYYGEYECTIAFLELDGLLRVLKRRNYEEIWINELAGYPDMAKWASVLVDLREQSAKKMRFLLHDFYAVCPSLNLLNYQGKYCKVPQDKEICKECLRRNEFVYSSEITSIEEWRRIWNSIIDKCDEVIAFSQDSIDIFYAAYSEKTKCQLIPHTIEPLPKVTKRVKDGSQPTVIGILGAISEQKGIKIVKSMLDYIEQNEINMKIVVIGETSEVIRNSALLVTGRYKREDIPELTEKYNIDCFFIPSIWPETFSYTTSEIISMDMPIAVFRIGAPVERVEKYDKGIVLGEPDMETGEIVSKLQNFV